MIRRQYLYEIRRRTSDWALFFAVLGISAFFYKYFHLYYNYCTLLSLVLMVFENEFSAAHIYDKSSWHSIMLKTGILLSTIVLVLFVIKFHVHEVQVSHHTVL